MKNQNVLYGLDSNVRLLAHSHLDHHQGDEELKCRPFHLSKLQFRQTQDISPTVQLKEREKTRFKNSDTEDKYSPLGCHISEVNLTDGGLLG